MENASDYDTRTATLRPRTPVPAIERPATRLLVTLAGVSFVAHMLVASNYGYFRDELYYIADGRHLQAGYVDQPLLVGWLAALMRVIAGDSLVAIHIIPALAVALIIVITGLMARELGGGRVAQLIAGVAALFTLDFMAVGSIFSMDVLDQLWWALASLILVRLLRRDAPRLWLLVGLVIAIALLTKLTVLFFCLALALAVLVTPERRYLRTPWPYLAAGIAGMGLLPDVIWNALNGWPTWEFWHNYGGVGLGLLDVFASQITLMNPIAVPLAVVGLVFYFRATSARYRLLGWTFVFVYLILTILRVKAYFLAPAYPILFASGALVLERVRLRPRLGWTRPAYVAVLGLVGILLAPAVMPILPPTTVVRAYGPLTQALGDRFGWDTLTQTVEQVYAALPPAQRAQACVLTSNYGEAGALQQLAAPGLLPPIISGHNNYYLWGPGTCTGQVLIAVGYSPSDFQHSPAQYHFTLAAIERCQYCVDYENNLPITVISGPAGSNLARLWPLLKHYE
ncbi:MAG: glycosyltransferase family 39 protein [Ktedonobacteraceae bacterium]